MQKSESSIDFKKILSNYWPLLFIILVSALLRLFRLGDNPPAVTNDEVVYIYNGYSIAKTFKDLTGQPYPWITKINIPFLPVPSYLLALIFQFFELSTFSGRLLNAILGVLQIILVYLLTIKLFKTRLVSFLSSLLVAISPWHLQLTRSAYDPVVAAFFYLLALYLFIVSQEVNMRKKIILYLLGFLNLFFALFSYRAMNILFVPWLIVTFWYLWPSIKNSKKTILLSFSCVFIIILSYFIILKPYSSYYFNEATKSETPVNFELAKKVIDNEITNSESPIWVSRIFINKFSYALRLLRENYLGVFSSEFLFTKGEASGIYSLWWRGMLYLIDLPLILLGINFLWKKNKRQAFFIILSVLIAPLPSVLGGPTGTSYVARSFYLIFFLMILSGSGLSFLYYLAKSKKKYYTIFAVVCFIYFIQVLSYLHQYHFRYPIYAADSWFKGTKDISEFLINSRNQHVVVSNSSNFDFINYAFYSKSNPVLVQQAYQKSTDKEEFQINNIEFKINCLNSGDLNPKDFLPKNTIYITKTSCHEAFMPDKVIRRQKSKFLENESVLWKIYYSKDLLKQ